MRQVSIPFIAGQWSLRPAWTLVEVADAGFNPLHCGAVVASPRASITKLRRWPASFNPLHCGAVVASNKASGRGAGRGRGFNPLHCGAVVASKRRSRQGVRPRRFQSPSLRGSGRFLQTKLNKCESDAGFNPLHCGAVVASRRARVPPNGGARFNPLHCGAVVASRRVAMTPPPALRRFNPLHCGAVVASETLARLRSQAEQVSIPFIAGQWSLPENVNGPVSTGSCFNPLHCGAVVASNRQVCLVPPVRPCFNPLHCGAVVASVAGQSGPSAEYWFQSPSLRGSGRFRKHFAACGFNNHCVSIPFIAGQWSLQYGSSTPLPVTGKVSIPFIAGQWSLQAGEVPFRCRGAEFQSPSLRGSGRFDLIAALKRALPTFQSPSLRGSGRFKKEK